MIMHRKKCRRQSCKSGFCGKSKGTGKIIDDEFTGEIDKDFMETGMYKGMMASLGDLIPHIIQKRNMRN